MSKTPQGELVKSVASEMAGFLKNGEINPDFVESNLEFKGIDRIQDLETILRIHFVLSDEVVDFLEELPKRVRRIKTESEKEQIRRKGEIRGRVNWSRTVVEQKRSNDRSIFYSENPSKNYNVSENLVLKKLLSKIYVVLDNDLEKPLEMDYNWLKRLEEEKELINYLKNIYRRNVHVERIKDPESYILSERDISVAENSRKQLYKEAAALWNKYRRLMDGKMEDEEMEELLNETLILPGDAPTMFELYAVFKYLLMLKEDFEIRKIEGGESQIAVFEGDEKKVLVYHDSTGDMSFFEGLDEFEKTFEREEIESKYLKRFGESTLKHAELVKDLLGKDSNSLYSGRPDILVEYYEDYENDDLEKLAIGEVKYSAGEQTFSKGLKELIQYLYFACEDEGYIVDLDEEESDVEGLLFIDEKEFLRDDKLDEENRVEGDSLPFKIEIYDTEDLEEYEIEEVD